MPSAHKAILDDAAWIAALGTEAFALAAEWWPVRIPTELTIWQAELNIEAPGQSMWADDDERGFFICRPGFLPEHPPLRPEDPPGAIGAELVIWIVKPRLPRRRYREVLTGLFTVWLEDEVARGEYEYGFGSMPTTMPPGDRNYLDGWVTRAGVQVTEYDGPGSVLWRRYWGRMADAVERLP